MANKKKLTKRRIAEMEQRAKKEKKLKMIKMIVAISLAVLLVAGITTWIIVANYEEPPVKYEAQIQIKDKGTVTVSLDNDHAPKAVAKFMELAGKGTYNGKSFYSSENGKVYGGDKDGSASHIFGEFNNGLSHKKGVISMAKSTGNTVNPSSFFITTKDNTALDKDCVAFGEIISGLDIIEGLEISESNKPIIEKITIIEK